MSLYTNATTCRAALNSLTLVMVKDGKNKCFSFAHLLTKIYRGVQTSSKSTTANIRENF